MRRVLALIVSLAAGLCAQKVAKQTVVKIQKTSMSRDQEIQLGKEAAAQVEREMELVKNPQLESWLNQIGQRLAKAPEANAYPYYFKLVNEPSINAFALPGGPMYVHTGLLQAAETEGEVAGVLAHEMSHVALRHGAVQMGKQQTWGTIFGVAGAAAGIATTRGSGECGMLCQAGQMATSIGGNAVLMKFSRGFERDADLNGARMLSSIGYDPIGLPSFFEKLAAKAGSAGEPKGLALWMSSHPASGSRAQYVSEDMKFYPARQYTASTGNFDQVKQMVAKLPPPKPKPGFLLQAKQGATPRGNLPPEFKDYQANGFAMAYPGSWGAGQAQGGGNLFMAPPGGVTKGQDGGIELLAGAMLGYYVPQSGGAVELHATTKEFLDSIQKSDKSLHAGPAGKAEIGGQPATLTKVTTKTSYQQDPNQTIYLYTAARDTNLWFLVLAAPSSPAGDLEPVFKQMLATVEFPK